VQKHHPPLVNAGKITEKKLAGCAFVIVIAMFELLMSWILVVASKEDAPRHATSQTAQ
jgi:hypothetical protein